jgi:hypothetical protein
MNNSKDTPLHVLRQDSPDAERWDAQVELIQQSLPDNTMMKMAESLVEYCRDTEQGMGQQSQVYDRSAVINDRWIEKPGILTFDELRAVSINTPLISSIVSTRARQVSSFSSCQEEAHSPGFLIKHRDINHAALPEEIQEMQAISHFITNCGWESRPRIKKRLGRSSFASFLSASVRDSLIFDASPIELELRGDGVTIDGFYPIDGSTIRLCGPQGYQGDPDITGVQLVNGSPVCTFTDESLIYEIRNDTTDITRCGYGTSEIELLTKIITGYLNAFAYNAAGFDKNTIPAGIWTVIGDFPDAKLTEFERRIKGQMTGANNAWRTLLMSSKDKDSRIDFNKIDSGFSDIFFEKWFSFLTAIACAIYGISPEEIGFGSFGDKGGLIGNNSYVDRISSSNDRGLIPLLHFYETTITDYIINEISPKYVFRFDGLKAIDKAARDKLNTQILTINELRAQTGMPNIDEPWAHKPIGQKD